MTTSASAHRRPENEFQEPSASPLPSLRAVHAAYFFSRNVSATKMQPSKIANQPINQTKASAPAPDWAIRVMPRTTKSCPIRISTYSPWISWRSRTVPPDLRHSSPATIHPRLRFKRYDWSDKRFSLSSTTLVCRSQGIFLLRVRRCNLTIVALVDGMCRHLRFELRGGRRVPSAGIALTNRRFQLPVPHSVSARAAGCSLWGALHSRP